MPSLHLLAYLTQTAGWTLHLAGLLNNGAVDIVDDVVLHSLDVHKVVELQLKRCLNALLLEVVQVICVSKVRLFFGLQVDFELLLVHDFLHGGDVAVVEPWDTEDMLQLLEALVVAVDLPGQLGDQLLVDLGFLLKCGLH